MGRSVNSRNRIFVEDGEGIRTQAFDPSKLTDPSLIIYAPVRVLGNKTIVTNGDQTDTIYEGMDKQMTFEQSLRSREFEPDGPNYTPRISGIMHIENGTYNYATVSYTHLDVYKRQVYGLWNRIWHPANDKRADSCSASGDIRLDPCQGKLQFPGCRLLLRYFGGNAVPWRIRVVLLRTF